MLEQDIPLPSFPKFESKGLTLDQIQEQITKFFTEEDLEGEAEEEAEVKPKSRFSDSTKPWQPSESAQKMIDMVGVPHIRSTNWKYKTPTDRMLAQFQALILEIKNRMGEKFDFEKYEEWKDVGKTYEKEMYEEWTRQNRLRNLKARRKVQKIPSCRIVPAPPLKR